MARTHATLFLSFVQLGKFSLIPVPMTQLVGGHLLLGLIYMLWGVLYHTPKQGHVYPHRDAQVYVHPLASRPIDIAMSGLHRHSCCPQYDIHVGVGACPRTSTV